MLEICDEVNIYNNTEVLREIIYLRQGNIVWTDKKMPKWMIASKINYVLLAVFI